MSDKYLLDELEGVLMDNAYLRARVKELEARETNLENSLDTMSMLFAQVQRDAPEWVQFRQARELLNKGE